MSSNQGSKSRDQHCHAINREAPKRITAYNTHAHIQFKCFVFENKRGKFKYIILFLKL